MTITELKQILEAYGIPCEFGHFSSPQKPPYIAWIYTGSDNEYADNMVCKSQKTVQIEFYVRNNVPQQVLLFENYLTANRVRWEMTSDQWIDTEKMYLFTYSTGVFNE